MTNRLPSASSAAPTCQFPEPRIPSGRLHRMAVVVLGLLIAASSLPTALGQTFTELYKFCPAAGCKDGYHPQAGLVADAAGDLYGVTESGGAYNSGVVFEITAAGAYKVLHSFKGGKTDGAGPSNASLVRDAAGNLYGVTAGGGAYSYGTVFKLTSKGQETLLHSFKGAPDGYGPDGGLILDAAGNLYGTTLAGGIVNSACNGGKAGCGTVFKVTAAGVETVLYRFCSKTACTDGGAPQGGMVRNTAGYLYGTTSGGGAHKGGTVFELANGKETVVYSFCALAGCADGEVPSAGLVMDKSGNLYGATASGGAHKYGTVFKITAKDVETVLHSFAGPPTDGVEPVGGLAIDSAGRLYGTTFAGGAHKYGTVFRLTASGTGYKVAILHSFALADGYQPYGTVLLDAHDSVYGTALDGGNIYGASESPCYLLGCGVVFKVIP